MIDFPKDVRERELRLLIARAMYERHVEAETAALVEREFNRVLDILLSAKYRDLTAGERLRTAQLFRELDRILQDGYGKIAEQHVAEMPKYAQLEADIARASANAVLATTPGEIVVSFFRLPKAYLQAIAKLPIQGFRIGDWFEAQATEDVRRDAAGHPTGPDRREALHRDRAPDPGTRPSGREGWRAAPVSRRAVNEAKSIARTTVNAVQNDATKTSNAALSRSVSDSYMWVAVNDTRTSAICRGLDGRVWKYDDPTGLVPPAHIGCRSTTRALLKGADLTLKVQSTPPTMRGYEAWLSTQNITTQNDILGRHACAVVAGQPDDAGRCDRRRSARAHARAAAHQARARRRAITARLEIGHYRDAPQSANPRRLTGRAVPMSALRVPVRGSPLAETTSSAGSAIHVDPVREAGSWVRRALNSRADEERASVGATPTASDHDVVRE
jgi:SPP1 gp7 family putative phage head morphogenesis protein